MYVYLVDDDPLVLASLQSTLAGRYETRAENVLKRRGAREIPLPAAVFDQSLAAQA